MAAARELEYLKALSSCAFNVDVRRYIAGIFRTVTSSEDYMLDSMPRLKLKRQRQQDKSETDGTAALDALAAASAGGAGGGSAISGRD